MTGRFVSHFIDDEIEIQRDYHLPKGTLLLSSTARCEACIKITKSQLFSLLFSVPHRTLKNLAFLNTWILGHFPHLIAGGIMHIQWDLWKLASGFLWTSSNILFPFSGLALYPLSTVSFIHKYNYMLNPANSSNKFPNKGWQLVSEVELLKPNSLKCG